MATLRFANCHGTANDSSTWTHTQLPSDPAALAPRLCDRRRGMARRPHPPGAATADCRMEMYNADGSRAEMCGNGIRCVGECIYDRGVRKSPMRVETDCGVKTLEFTVEARGLATAAPSTWAQPSSTAADSGRGDGRVDRPAARGRGGTT